MQTFRNDDVDRVIETIVDKATGHMRDAGISDSEILRRRALDHWNTRKKTAFAQGDIWFATLLINDRGSTKGDEEGGIPTIGICDWEFAGPNHPAADIAQLGSPYLNARPFLPC
jgi:thiamine kinase-like enzyme